MRVLLTLVGVVLLAYFVADRVRQLPSQPVASVSQSIAVAAPLPEPSLKALAAAEPPAAYPVEPPAAHSESRLHPVALVSLDPTAARFPSRPSDPVSGFALVLPAPASSGPAASDARWWQGDNGRDWTSDFTHLRLAWPGASSHSTTAAPADLPSSPAAIGSVRAETENPAQAPPLAEADTTSARVASVEALAEPADRGLPESSGTPAPAPAPTADAPPVETPPMPVARSDVSAGAVRGAAQLRQTRQASPPPPRRLASATPEAGLAGAKDERPSLVCSSSACGPRLLLLGVGF